MKSSNNGPLGGPKSISIQLENYVLKNHFYLKSALMYLFVSDDPGILVEGLRSIRVVNLISTLNKFPSTCEKYAVPTKYRNNEKHIIGRMVYKLVEAEFKDKNAIERLETLIKQDNKMLPKGLWKAFKTKYGSEAGGRKLASIHPDYEEIEEEEEPIIVRIKRSKIDGKKNEPEKPMFKEPREPLLATKTDSILHEDLQVTKVKSAPSGGQMLGWNSLPSLVGEGEEGDDSPPRTPNKDNAYSSDMSCSMSSVEIESPPGGAITESEEDWLI